MENFHTDFHNRTAKITTSSLIDLTVLGTNLRSLLYNVLHISTGCFSGAVDC